MIILPQRCSYQSETLNGLTCSSKTHARYAKKRMKKGADVSGDLNTVQQSTNELQPIKIGEPEVDVDEPAQITGSVEVVTVECFDRVRKLRAIDCEHKDDVVYPK